MPDTYVVATSVGIDVQTSPGEPTVFATGENTSLKNLMDFTSFHSAELGLVILIVYLYIIVPCLI